MAIIWSLYVVAQEMLNDVHVRSLAVQHLRQINSSLGVREADFLADAIESRADRFAMEAPKT